jgi:hypothetical protein
MSRKFSTYLCIFLICWSVGLAATEALAALNMTCNRNIYTGACLASCTPQQYCNGTGCNIPFPLPDLYKCLAMMGATCADWCNGKCANDGVTYCRCDWPLQCP